MTQDASSPETWWGAFQIPHGSAGSWRLGPLTLRVGRQAGEWVVWQASDGDPHDETMQVLVPDDTPAPEDGGETVRFAVSGRSEELSLVPLLADRPVISRPESAMVVPGDEDVVLYVSTPLWVGLSVGGPPELIEEIPVNVLSNTWFGPSTMEGELCYASRTHFVVDPDRVARLMHRASTCVRIRNRSQTPLELERLKLPLTHLCLIRMADGSLWTQDLTLVRSQDGDKVKLELQDREERLKKQGSELLAEAREKPSSTALERAFGSIFSERRK